MAAAYARPMRFSERLTTGLADHRFAVDLAATVVLAVVLVPTSVAFDQSVGAPGTTVTQLWALMLVAPLAWRRVRPVGSAVAVFLVGLAQVLLGPWLVFPADLVVLLSLYSVTVYGPRWAGRAAMVSVVVGSAVFVVRTSIEMGLAEGLVSGGSTAGMMAALGLAIFAFGLLRRSREARLEVLRERAERLERERDQQHRLAASAERSRIAREMHDVVAHSLSVVVAQADGGRYAAEHDPDAAIHALGTISDTGRAALADMRRILGILRTDVAADADAGPDVEFAPQPASGDLDALVEQIRSLGVRVSVVRLGVPQTLPPGMGLTAYRIYQEALTNVVKHAGPDAEVTVLEQWTASGLVLEVTDDGRGAAAADDGGGHGLLGMRERAALFGGTVSAGPRPGGGFRVHVELPVPTPAQTAGDVVPTTTLPAGPRS